jgi:hypothetical protein
MSQKGVKVMAPKIKVSRQILVHLQVGREGTHCGRGATRPAFVTPNKALVTCPRCAPAAARTSRAEWPTTLGGFNWGHSAVEYIDTPGENITILNQASDIPCLSFRIYPTSFRFAPISREAE